MVILGVVLAALFLVLDTWIKSDVYDHLDSLLADQADKVAGAIRYDDATVFDQVLPEYRSPGHTEFFTLYNQDLKPLMISANSRGFATPAPGQRAELPLYYEVRTPDGHRGRAFASVPEGLRDGHFLVVATERSGWDVTERRIHSALLAGIAVSIAVVVLLVQWIVRRAFRPLLLQGERLARLDTEQPPHRIGENMPTELAPFVASMNLGLQRLYDAVARERRFSRDIAHELRTPLAEARTAAEVALQAQSEAELRQGLTTAIAATERMQRSVDTLLSLARFESGQESPALDPLDLTQLAAAQIEVLQRFAQERGIELRLTTTAAAWTHSDIGISERILMNLLQNAVDYAPRGSVVRCAIDSSARGHTLRVDNEAPELTAEDLKHLGTRFWRKLHEGGTAQHAGLGLALAFALARSLEVDLDFQLIAGRLHASVGPFRAL